MMGGGRVLHAADDFFSQLELEAGKAGRVAMGNRVLTIAAYDVLCSGHGPVKLLYRRSCMFTLPMTNVPFCRAPLSLLVQAMNN